MIPILRIWLRPIVSQAHIKSSEDPFAIQKYPQETPYRIQLKPNRIYETLLLSKTKIPPSNPSETPSHSSPNNSHVQYLCFLRSFYNLLPRFPPNHATPATTTAPMTPGTHNHNLNHIMLAIADMIATMIIVFRSLDIPFYISIVSIQHSTQI